MTSCAFIVLVAQSSTSQTIVDAIPLPSTTYWNQAYGLAADSSSLYASSGTTTSVYNRGHVYTLDTLGNRIDSVATGLTSSQGLAWDGTFFWYVKGSGSSLRIYKIAKTGVLADSILPPTTWYFGGACWDGTGLWVSLYYPNNLVGLYKYDVVTKTIVDTIPSLGLQPQGIAWDGSYIYYAMDNNDGDAEKIYQVDPVTNDTVRSWFLPEGQTSNMSPRGLTWDGRYLWLIAEPVSASSGRSLYKYDLEGSGTPAINVPTSFFDFGVVQTDSSQDVVATIRNIGTANLTIDSVRVLYSNRFTTNLSTPLTIAPGNSSDFNLTFAPTAYGTDSAHFVLYHNDPARPPQTIRVVGFGNYTLPVIAVPGSHDYGTRRTGSSNLWIMAIQNQGSQQLIVDSARFTLDGFSGDTTNFPLIVASVSSRNLRVWYSPQIAATYSDTMRLYSNASNLPVASIALLGSGDATPLVLGSPFWTTTVPLHPISNTFRRVRAVRGIGDISGDGKPDVIVCTDNYWTMALNGNSSAGNDSLWAFSSYVSSSSAGPIGSEGDYSYQKALAIASDLNGDSTNDVVIGTGGGNEHVYAISGRTGQMLWTFGTDHPDSFSLGDISGVDASTDFNNDDVPDVVAAGSATGTGGAGGRRSVYLFNGANGNPMWQAPLLGFTHAVTAIPDITGDGIPDVIGTVGEPSYKAEAFNGANGTHLWDFPLASSTGGAKEVLVLPMVGESPDVVIGAFWGPIYRVDGETGDTIWQRPTGGKDPTRLARLRDVTNDGIDEIVASMLIGDAWCLDGATGDTLWSYAANSGMDITTCPDLNNDGFDEVVVASQNADVLILRGNNGELLYQYPLAGSEQARSVAVLPDLDENGSHEIITGSDASNVVLVSGGLDATPVHVESRNGLPTEFSVSPNYPNPFNPATAIEITLPAESDISLRIFDILGCEVRSFGYERVPAGVHKVVWDGRNMFGSSVASGVYFCQVRVGDRVLTRRMLMLK